MEESPNQKIVENYYELVDKRDFENMLDLFSDDIVYHRCEKKIEGKQNLRYFYLEERKLTGYHKLDDYIPKDNKIISYGTYIEGEHRIDFCDIFTFLGGKIKERRTYLAKGYELIK